MKEQFTTTVHVSGSGDSKAKAFSDALSRVQSTLLRATDKVLLRIEPQDVKVLRAQEQVKNEKFLFFFLARQRRYYRVELEITVSVTAINTQSVTFTTTE
ncbi:MULTISPECIES: DUF4312 family protein [Musicola]|uniref:DUF4312 family protein n=1 Tax=Musicola paradisiaca (strain Ech703) TaxID=579405 RepID=C6CCS8_MUSP7|nr:MULTISPECIES: DUF4312 family protein [Musicola]ACS86921.1 conserved hypothetical protein [Musicola paradisiaca Ech703]